MTTAPTGAAPTPAVAADPDHRQVVVPNWQIPLRVGQRTALTQGDIIWVPGPSPRLWRLLAAAAFALMVLVGWRSWYSLLAVLVVIAVTADAFHTIGALMGSLAPPPTKLSASLISVVAWAAALAALAAAPPAAAGRPDPAAGGRHAVCLRLRRLRCAHLGKLLAGYHPRPRPHPNRHRAHP